MAQIDTITPELAWRLEEVECAAFADCYRAVPRDVAKECGVAVYEVGEAIATVAACADVLALNRMMGPGMLASGDAAAFDAILRHYEDAGVPRVFVQADPVTANADVAELVRARGGNHYNNWVKLYRGVEPIPPVKSDLRTEVVSVAHAAAFSQIVAESFGWPEAFQKVVAAGVGREGWRHYMAFDGDTPVATAALFVSGKTGWIDFAATLEGYRGRGAQGKLTEIRFLDAAELGCDLLVVETAQQTPEHDAPSYRNMLRYGFKEAYVRPNYLITL